jgi:hypothetical membrane protein
MTTPSDRPATPTATTFPATISRGVMLGAALWTLSIIFFIVQAIAIGDFSPPYSLATNLISDLGNTACTPDLCSPLHTFVNAAFIAVGLCHVLGAAATFRAWPRVRSVNVGIDFLVVAGVGLMVAGLAPENVAPGAHAAGALVGLVAINVAMLALGWSLQPIRQGLGRLTLGAGIVGVVGLGYFLSGQGLPGITERIADYPSAAMVVVLGATILLATPAQRVRAPWTQD